MNASVTPSADPGGPRVGNRAREQSDVLERLPAVIYLADTGGQGTWRYVSPQIESLLGYTPEEWCADAELWACCLHPDERETVIAGELKVELGLGDGKITEYRMLHRDGRVVWIRDDAVLILDADGVRRWHGVLSDITDRKLVELELARSAAQHAAVAALGEHALEGATPSTLAEEAVAAAMELLGFKLGVVARCEEGAETVRLLAAAGFESTDRLLPSANLPSVAHALHEGEFVVEDWRTETRAARNLAMNHAGVRSTLAVRVESRRGPLGVLSMHDLTPRRYSQIDLDFAHALANVLGDAYERQLTEDAIRHRALHDPLTGLPNRALFMDRLGQAVRHLDRRGSSAAILVLDIDRFQLVNDSLGHDVGDELLAAAAPRLNQTVRTTDTVARFGADEFGILLEDIGGEQAAVEMAQRIAAVFTRPFVLAGEEHFVTTSAGIVIATGGERAEDLVRDADAAMNRAKERGRARYELFDDRIRGRAMSRLRVENDLRRALERDELTLDYQPIVSLSDGAIVCAEALVRWESPTRGRVAPVEFIPIAEENGLIEPIGRWVLAQACRQAARWCAERPDARPLSIAVNLSAVQLQPGLPGMVATALSGSGLDPALLALEVTESVMMGHSPAFSDILTDLRKLGVRLVLDDFGTGYSSMAYLTRLPLEVLKVDRSFIAGLGSDGRDTAICEAIIAMSHALGLEVVAEGAETAQHVAELARLGCDRVQGFHFSRPVDARSFGALLDRPLRPTDVD